VDWRRRIVRFGPLFGPDGAFSTSFDADARKSTVSMRIRSVSAISAVSLLLVTATGCASDSTFSYLSRNHWDGSSESTTRLAEGWHTIELMSASDYPQGPFRTGDENRSCMVQAEIIQATDTADREIFNGRTTTGFRYIARFKWSELAAGGLDGADLTGSTTLFGSDWGPVRIYLPETAEYLFQARASGGGRTDIEVCRFRVVLRSE